MALTRSSLLTLAALVISITVLYFGLWRGVQASDLVGTDTIQFGCVQPGAVLHRQVLWNSPRELAAPPVWKVSCACLRLDVTTSPSDNNVLVLDFTLEVNRSAAGTVGANAWIAVEDRVVMAYSVSAIAVPMPMADPPTIVAIVDHGSSRVRGEAIIRRPEWAATMDVLLHDVPIIPYLDWKLSPAESGGVKIGVTGISPESTSFWQLKIEAQISATSKEDGHLLEYSLPIPLVFHDPKLLTLSPASVVLKRGPEARFRLTGDPPFGPNDLVQIVSVEPVGVVASSDYRDGVLELRLLSDACETVEVLVRAGERTGSMTVEVIP
jgi:hypothetical protein